MKSNENSKTWDLSVDDVNRHVGRKIANGTLKNRLVNIRSFSGTVPFGI